MFIGNIRENPEDKMIDKWENPIDKIITSYYFLSLVNETELSAKVNIIPESWEHLLCRFKS